MKAAGPSARFVPVRPGRRPWRCAGWIGALLALLLMAGLAWAARGDPVVIDSPAWQALMARPAADGDATAFYAAELLEAWGRPAEAATLRRQLLARHLRGLAGATPAPATLGEVWRGAAPNADELAQLHASAAARQPRAAWAAIAPAHDGAIRAIVERIGNRPSADLPAFVQTWSDCVRQGTCRPRDGAAPVSDAERQARADARRRERERQRAEDDRKSREQQRRYERFELALVSGYLLGALLLHLLLARYAGKVVAVLVTLAIGPALAVLAYSRWGLSRDWGGLAMMIFYLGLASSGLLMAPVFHWVHKTWFAGR